MLKTENSNVRKSTTKYWTNSFGKILEYKNRFEKYHPVFQKKILKRFFGTTCKYREPVFYSVSIVLTF